MSFAADFRTRSLTKSVVLGIVTLTRDDDERVTAESAPVNATIAAEIQFGGQEQGETKSYSRSIITGDAELYTAPNVITLPSNVSRYLVTYDSKTYAVEKQLDSIVDHEGSALVDVFTLKLITS